MRIRRCCFAALDSTTNRSTSDRTDVALLTICDSTRARFAMDTRRIDINGLIRTLCVHADQISAMSFAVFAT